MRARRASAGAALLTAAVVGLGRCTPAAPPRVADVPDASAAPTPPDAFGGGELAPDAAPDVGGDRGVEAPSTDAAAAEASAAAPSDAGTSCTAEKKVRWLPAAPDAWTRCGKDAHCVIVADGCCSCGVLRASMARAVNLPTARNGNPYCAPGTGCPACAGFANPDLEAVCLSGRCRVRESVDPCKLGRAGLDPLLLGG